MMNKTPNFTERTLTALSMLTLVCCLGILCYSAVLVVVMGKSAALFPTPTLDPNCESTSCLNACLSRITTFEMLPLDSHWNDLDHHPGGYDLARYWVRQADKTLERMSTPAVPEYLKTYQDDTPLHTRIWDYFKQVFPVDENMHLSYVDFYVDANVERASAGVWEANGRWTLYINLLEFDSAWDTTEILAHEYGHMLTLNATQTQEVGHGYLDEFDRKEFDQKRRQCGGNFFTGYECTASTAYLNLFGNQFWPDEVYEAWIEVFLLRDKDADQHAEAIQKFYETYPDQFVSEYAATNPVEDIAEAWTEFILRSRPTGDTIANQKVLFFYDFPELIQTRGQIIRNVCQHALDQK